MQNNAQLPDFPTGNPFSEHFQKFGNTRLFDRLQNKFTPKPYYYQYRTLRAVVLGASFLFHILSAATAAALIFLFVGKLIPSAMAAGAVTLAALVALELSKRETSGRFFHDALQFGKFAPGLLAVVLGLAAISTTCSYFGAERAVKALTPPPALVDADTLTAPIRGSLATIDGQIADAKKNTWQGKVTARAQRTIDRLTRQREALTNELIRQQTRADTRNDATETEHTATTEANASGFAAFTLCCEVLLIFSLWYLQYYDYRSFAEYCAKPEGKPADIAGLPAPKPAEQPAPSTAGSLAAELLSSPPNGNGKNTSNGTSNETLRRPIGYAYANRNAHARTENVITQNVGSNRRTCEHCGIEYTYGHARQKYCCDGCRVAAWENRTGRTLKKPKPT